MMGDLNNPVVIRFSRFKRFFKRFFRQKKNKAIDFFSLKKVKKEASLKIAFFILCCFALLIFLFSLPFLKRNHSYYFSSGQKMLLLEENLLLGEALNRYIEYQDYATLPLPSTNKISPSFEKLEVSTYRVENGETLGKIARKFNLSLGTLISFNKINDVRKVRSGSEIRIPSSDGVIYTVVKGDSLEGISKRYQSDINKICDYNNLSSEVIQIGQQLFLPGVSIDSYTLDKALGRLFLPPTKGRLTSGFGYRADPFTGRQTMHNGLDIANVIGTPITASKDGKVVYVDNRPKGYGNVVILKHNDGYQTLYAHMNTITVKTDEWVSQGQKIGTMGSSGRSTGPHLHFSIFKNNIPQNPLNYVHY